jgi:hypothetical protein
MSSPASPSVLSPTVHSPQSPPPQSSHPLRRTPPAPPGMPRRTPPSRAASQSSVSSSFSCIHSEIKCRTATPEWGYNSLPEMRLNIPAGSTSHASGTSGTSDTSGLFDGTHGACSPTGSSLGSSPHSESVPFPECCVCASPMVPKPSQQQQSPQQQQKEQWEEQCKQDCAVWAKGWAAAHLLIAVFDRDSHVASADEPLGQVFLPLSNLRPIQPSQVERSVDGGAEGGAGGGICSSCQGQQRTLSWGFEFDESIVQHGKHAGVFKGRIRLELRELPTSSEGVASPAHSAQTPHSAMRGTGSDDRWRDVPMGFSGSDTDDSSSAGTLSPDRDNQFHQSRRRTALSPPDGPHESPPVPGATACTPSSWSMFVCQ